MKKIIVTSTLLFIFNTTNSNASTGEQALEQVLTWYNNTVDDCGDATKPAFLCSGVMLRAIETNPDPVSLVPISEDVTNEGISFSWLRADNNFSSLAYMPNNGFIIYPYQYIPSSNLSDISFLCAFPMNADSSSRDSHGCGANTEYPQQSKPCDQTGIYDATQWIAQFNTPNANRYRIQCGWDVKEGQPDRAQRFNENILARNLMESKSWEIQNEIRVKKWLHDETLPVHSFFYIKDDINALKNAMSDQRSHYKQYNQVIPILEVTLPNNKSENADFNYINESQEIGSGITVSDSSPIIPDARGNNNNQLWRSTYYAMAALTVKIPVYEGMEKGQSISVTWRGPNPRLDYDETKTVTGIDDTFFTIPRPNVIDAAGANVRIAYSVLDLEGNTVDSQTSILSIERQPVTLPIARINLSTRQVTISYPEMNDTQTVNLNWYGSQNHKFEPQQANNSGTIIFEIPQEWIEENRDRSVYLIYSTEIEPGERNIFSRVLVVNIN
ncbi:hypothetical protein [uncultured Cedecea sp.]|uniref:hypothetical protein n=1 Tax=uncultured Cedecea sp. TaxID=988762 RepID=UPI002611D84F|nr:hypothetical protein [uncultured Cedecea sp.]